MPFINNTSFLGAKTICSNFGTLSLLLRNASKKVPEDAIKKSVFISQSTDIYRNLALEDWLYRNNDFSKHHVLLLWKNDPCVVIGRQQNPWLDSNVSAVAQNNIAVARRNSGGGAVYHDSGNLNLSFFAPSERHNKRYNLDIIGRAMFREWGLKSSINAKENIIVQDEFKVSNTAAKVGSFNAYHHCTMLVDANKQALNLALASESAKQRFPVKNLKEVNSQVTFEQLLASVGWEYLRTDPLTLQDGGKQLLQQQNGFQMINPSEDWFPGIERLMEKFRSWAWTYGETPKFTVTRMLEGSTPEGQKHFMKLSIEVESGIVQDVKMSLPSDLSQNASVMTNVRGEPYSPEITESIVKATGCKLTTQHVAAVESNVASL